MGQEAPGSEPPSGVDRTDGADAETPAARRPGTSAPQPRDILIGAAVAERRRRLGLRQHQVAQALGVAPQQLQKYESGINRLSASRLYDVAQILQCEVNDFFGEIVKVGQEGARLARAVASLLKAVYGPAAAERFNALPRSSQRKIVNLLAPLARSLVGGVVALDEREVQPPDGGM